MALEEQHLERAQRRLVAVVGAAGSRGRPRWRPCDRPRLLLAAPDRGGTAASTISSSRSASWISLRRISVSSVQRWPALYSRSRASIAGVVVELDLEDAPVGRDRLLGRRSSSCSWTRARRDSRSTWRGTSRTCRPRPRTASASSRHAAGDVGQALEVPERDLVAAVLAERAGVGVERQRPRAELLLVQRRRCGAGARPARAGSSLCVTITSSTSTSFSNSPLAS